MDKVIYVIIKWSYRSYVLWSYGVSGHYFLLYHLITKIVPIDLVIFDIHVTIFMIMK